jgi:hypothetical protein
VFNGGLGLCDCFQLVLVSYCGLWKCVFRFLMLGAFCTLCGLNLYGFGDGCEISVG